MLLNLSILYVSFKTNSIYNYYYFANLQLFLSNIAYSFTCTLTNALSILLSLYLKISYYLGLLSQLFRVSLYTILYIYSPYIFKNGISQPLLYFLPLLFFVLKYLTIWDYFLNFLEHFYILFYIYILSMSSKLGLVYLCLTFYSYFSFPLKSHYSRLLSHLF
jgi:hypothetical protein